MYGGIVYPYSPGQRVRATRLIAFPDFGKELHTHAEPDDEGTVECVDDGCPTVRFDKSGTSTIVADFEVAAI